MLAAADAGVIVLVALVGVVIFIVALVAESQKAARVKTAWQKVGARFGMRIQPGGFFKRARLVGNQQQCALEIRIDMRGGKHKHPYTVITCGLPRSLRLGLRVYREGMLSGLGKLFGAQDIQTGDLDFDREYMIKGRSEAGVLRLLDDGMRQSFARYDHACGPLVLSDDAIVYDTRGRIDDAGRLSEILAAELALASALMERS